MSGCDFVQRPARPASPGRGKNPFSSAACLAYDANGMPLPAATGATVNSALGTQDGGATVARTPPSPDSSLQERMGFVHWQLDQFTGSQLLLGKYKSLGPAARRQGGTLPPAPPPLGPPRFTLAAAASRSVSTACTSHSSQEWRAAALETCVMCATRHFLQDANLRDLATDQGH